MTVTEYNIAVEDYADNVYRFVLKHLKDEEAAKDIIQDTFSKVWLKRDSISFEKIKSYLFSTAYHTMIDAIRKLKPTDDITHHSHQMYTESHKDMDLQSILHRALDQLPDIQRTVVLLRDYEGYEYAEIGKITDLTESQVKVYIFRARKKLKEILVSVEAVLE